MILLAAAAGPVFAQNDDAALDEFTQTIYAGMEDSVRQEYDSVLINMARGRSASGTARFSAAQQALKILYYNKAALFAFCAADAERVRDPNAARVPAERNIVLTTCVEQKFGELSDFTNKLNYAGLFFPARIQKCGEAARLPEHEKLLPPYQFLHLEVAKLYDFARYNRCLMTVD